MYTRQFSPYCNIVTACDSQVQSGVKTRVGNAKARFLPEFGFESPISISNRNN